MEFFSIANLLKRSILCGFSFPKYVISATDILVFYVKIWGIIILCGQYDVMNSIAFSLQMAYA